MRAVILTKKGSTNGRRIVLTKPESKPIPSYFSRFKRTADNFNDDKKNKMAMKMSNE